jgi:hypothetical protein
LFYITKFGLIGYTALNIGISNDITAIILANNFYVTHSSWVEGCKKKTTDSGWFKHKRNSLN